MTRQKMLARLALLSATSVFAVNFAVWTLYAVMGIELKTELNLDATEFGILLAAPMLSGALLRFAAGLLCEIYSSRRLLVLQMLLLLPVLFYLPQINSYEGYILTGLVLGISGVSFTLGIRYITDWFPSAEQGMAMGIFGAGNAGAAISMVAIPYISEQWGWDRIGPFYAYGVMLTALLFFFLAPKSSLMQKTSAQLPSMHQILRPLRDAKVWRFGLYYYFVFGSFLALLLWLPHYFVTAYSLSLNKAMALTLLFVISSSMARAAGGWFADRYGARAVNWSVFWTCLICLFFLSYPPTTMIIHGVEKAVTLTVEMNLWVFLSLLLIVGVAQGLGRASVFKIIHDYYPNHMGSVGGTVAMVGALGGCTLPIMFGLAVDLIGVHSACFMVLYGVLAGCMILMHFAIKRERFLKRLADARQNNFLDQE